jgi:hypothetical protein
VASSLEELSTAISADALGVESKMVCITRQNAPMSREVFSLWLLRREKADGVATLVVQILYRNNKNIVDPICLPRRRLLP